MNKQYRVCLYYKRMNYVSFKDQFVHMCSNTHRKWRHWFASKVITWNDSSNSYFESLYNFHIWTNERIKEQLVFSLCKSHVNLITANSVYFMHTHSITPAFNNHLFNVYSSLFIFIWMGQIKVWGLKIGSWIPTFQLNSPLDQDLG